MADKARKSISSYCHNECKCYCCRNGYLILKGKETNLVTQNRRDELVTKNILTAIQDGNYSLKLGNSEEGCPSLKDHQCSIHANRGRPLACKEFPIFVKGNTVQFSHRCLAVKEGLFYKWQKKFLALGFKVVESDSIYDSEFYNMPTAKIGP